MSIFAKAKSAQCLRKSLNFLTDVLDAHPVLMMDSVEKEWNLSSMVEHQLVYEVSRTRLTPTGKTTSPNFPRTVFIEKIYNFHRLFW